MRKLLKGLVGLVVCALLLFGGVLAYVVLFLDPNAYRPQIEALAKEHGVALAIRGDLSWTLWPRLGIAVRDLTAAAPAQGITEPVQVQDFSVLVQLLPLLHKQILVDGIDINNVAWVYQAGVRQVSIRQLTVHTRDMNFANNTFPFTVNGVVEITNPHVTADIRIQAVLAVDDSMQHIRIDNVDVNSKLAGVPFGDLSPDLSLKLQGDIDLAKQIMQISKLALHVDKQRLTFAGNIEQLNSNPRIVGELTADIVGVNALLAVFAMPPIATHDPAVLQTVALKAAVKADAQIVQLNEVALTVDDTTLTGAINWHMDNATQSSVKLAGNTLDLDRYRAPHEKAALTSTGGGAGVSAAEQEVRVLPVADIRGLNGIFDLSFNELRVSGLTLTNISTAIAANKGVLDVKHFAADFYAGKLAATATVDANKDVPTITFAPTLRDVQLVPLLKAIAPERNDKVMVSSGALTLSGNLTTQGITRGELTRALNGTLDFSANDLVVDNVNVDREACQAASKVANKPLPANKWATNTQVKEFTGHANVVNGVIQQDVLQAQLDASGLRGTGEVVLLDEQYTYLLDVHLTSRSSAQFCSTLSDRWVDVEWPVRCTGTFGASPQCGVDQKRLGGLAKQLAKGEAQQKLDKAIDKKLGGEQGEAVKNLLKGLLH